MHYSLLIHSPIEGYLGCFQFWAVMNKTLLPSMYLHVVVWNKFSTHLGKYQGKYLLDLMVRVCLVLWETAKLTSTVAMPFCIPLPPYESSCCSTSSPAFGVVSILDFGHSNRCVVVSYCCFNLQFPNDIWCGPCFHAYCHLYIFFFFL